MAERLEQATLTDLDTLTGYERVVTGPYVEIGSVVSLYGVSPISPIGVDIDISLEELESNIKTLKEAVNTIETNWSGVINTNVKKLTNAWVGNDCAVYTRKLKNMDVKVSNSIKALNLLIQTYQKARDQIVEKQKTIASKISNME